MRTNSKPPNALGRKIRAARERKGITQAELAAAVGMRREDLVRLETGSRPANPSAGRVLAFAQALGVDVGELILARPRRAA